MGRIRDISPHYQNRKLKNFLQRNLPVVVVPARVADVDLKALDVLIPKVAVAHDQRDVIAKDPRVVRVKVERVLAVNQKDRKVQVKGTRGVGKVKVLVKEAKVKARVKER